MTQPEAPDAPPHAPHPPDAVQTPSDLFVRIWTLLEVRRVDDFPKPPPRLCLEAAKRLNQALDAEPFDGGGVLAWADGDAKRLMLLARGLDAAHAPLSRVPAPSVSSLPTWLIEARHRYIRTSRLNADPGARQLILRRPLHGRWSDPDRETPDGHGLSGFFEHLLTLPTTVPATEPRDKSASATVGLGFALHPAERGFVPPPGTPWRVGFVPLAQVPADMDIATFARDGHDWYDARPAPLATRVEEAVRRLCEDGCHIIALPEMALDSPAEEALRRAVRRHGPGSDLMLVLGGTHRALSPATALVEGVPVPAPANRALVLDRFGGVLLRQDKMSCWDLSHGQCDRFGLAKPTSDRRREYIEPGRAVQMAEYHGLGRIGVLVCEDLDRAEPGQWLRRHLLLDLQFTPVLDASLKSDAWTGTGGSKAALLGGCRVIVANSLVLTHCQNAANQAAGRHAWVIGEAGIGLMIDRAGPEVRAKMVSVSLTAPGTILRVDEWQPGAWESVPPPVS